MDKVVTEITSYCGDTYQKVELAHSTFYHRIKKKDDIAFLPSTNSLSLAVTEVDMLRSEITALRSQLSTAYADGAEAMRDAVKVEIRAGRTVVNFGHIPTVARALEWVLMDISTLPVPEREGKKCHIV